MLLAVLGFTVDLQKQDRFCFNQALIEGSSMQMTFFVVSGGSLEISSKIISPNGTELQSVSEQSSFSYAVDNAAAGNYQICIWNYDSTNRIVSFYINIVEPVRQKELQPLDQALLNTQEKMQSILQQQRQSQQMENRIVYQLNKVRASIGYNGAIKILCIVACSVYQIVSFKKYFAKKRTAV